ncbi:hypothetical protein [Chondrinema litorale]|uniref:hypothetical protein n=1 Tax=Chondrinema litorale TaxID=2994555 RepID=UPI00254332E6|nr:hypothetical protein [Chondrinema litorale]UZR98063.1 hypothetical protein OQ292_30015 [Chondrinema litorale]
MKHSFLMYILFFLFTTSLVSCDDNEDDNLSPEKPKQFTLQAIGVATGIPIQTVIEGVDIEVSGNAFTMDLFNKETGTLIGSVTDINVFAETFEDGSMQGENYTIFTFDEDNSTLVMHNFIDMTPIDNTTLQAVIDAPKTESNVIGGTGKFNGELGGSTLNATLDMTEFANGTIGFNCTYGIKIN